MDVISGHKGPNGRSYNTFVSPSGVYYAVLLVAAISTSTAFAQSAPLTKGRSYLQFGVCETQILTDSILKVGAADHGGNPANRSLHRNCVLRS